MSVVEFSWVRDHEMAANKVCFNDHRCKIFKKDYFDPDKNDLHTFFPPFLPPGTAKNPGPDMKNSER